MCLRVLYNLYISTSLSQNLTSNQEKLPNNPSRVKKKRREETFRSVTEEDPSPGWTGVIDVMCTEVIIIHKLKHSNNTINEYGSV